VLDPPPGCRVGDGLETQDHSRAMFGFRGDGCVPPERPFDSGAHAGRCVSWTLGGRGCDVPSTVVGSTHSAKASAASARLTRCICTRAI
jgi:hypothetical protein